MKNRFSERMVAGILLVVLGGCSFSPIKTDSGLDGRLDQALDKFCPIPEDKPENRIVRAKVVLAAISGYAYRSVKNYSSAQDAEEDVSRAVKRINTAYKSIGEAEKNIKSGLFPVERADMVIDLAAAAEAAITPTVRAGVTLVSASISDRISTMKKMAIAFLTNQLYLSAYQHSCKNFDALKTDQTAITTRIAKRCTDLAGLVGDTNKPACGMPTSTNEGKNDE